MTIVLTPYWSNGVQKLKVAAESKAPKRGLIPPQFDEATHEARCLLQLRSKTTGLEKYIYLSQLKHENQNMFYRLVMGHMSEITPVIYTPTVGDACINFSHIYRRPEGLYVSIKDKGKIRQVLENWPKVDETRISVITDGSRILGLGDLGVNGMGISIGKLSLYIAGAGIRPESTLPICLDLGTNTQRYLDDPLYLGLRQPRVGDAEMTAFMDELLDGLTTVFPKMMIQFEDFSTDNAFKYLDRYRFKHPVFNDDIQGTGAVVLSGFVNAARLASKASGKPLTSHRILFFGAGSAGVGVASQLTSFFTLNGLTPDQAKRQIWLVDSQGLVYNSRPGKLAEHKKLFSRDDYDGPPMKDLSDIIEHVRPTALLGLSTISGAFTSDILQQMAILNERPIVFPLSNPVRLSECSFHDALQNTEGRVLFASGSPFPEEEWDGKMKVPGQGNNMYIFPGIGLGAILSKAKQVTDTMVEAASLGLAGSLNAEETAGGLIYPRIERIREISIDIAKEVIRAAQKSNVDSSPKLRVMSDAELTRFIKQKVWSP